MLLTITERADLYRRHGLIVCIESGGIAYCRDAQGRCRQYPAKELRTALEAAA